MSRPHIAIIGGGPAGLIAADVLANTCEVHLYEQARTVGRKFLVAGEGGLNITNRVEGEEMLGQYAPKDRMRPILAAFGPAELRAWLAELGVPTFIGSSGRVFPEKGIKPAEVLKAIVDRLTAKGVQLHVQHTFVGFDAVARPLVERNGQQVVIEAENYLFGLGGASWAKTGSTGDWTAYFQALGVRTIPFAASNCGVELVMPEALRVHVGKPLKNIRITAGDRSVRGEATLTEHGLEGNAVYPVVPAIREALARGQEATLIIDLKPDLTEAELERRLAGAAWKERMATVKLDRVQVALLKAFTPMHRFIDGSTLITDVKQLRVPVRALRPIDEAISTVGGIPWDELNDDLSLKQYPRIFVAGEMVDWDAPTGGFLLQGCFATGHHAASAIQRAQAKSESKP
ncbi:MAG: TIGR03862 family flavoprotein [Flavobacteriales bacterium]|nr:TIGR03862 family flavoprotein [Flavobacteriales bacterium]